jgi:hypothetical protein
VKAEHSSSEQSAPLPQGGHPQAALCAQQQQKRKMQLLCRHQNPRPRHLPQPVQSSSLIQRANRPRRGPWISVWIQRPRPMQTGPEALVWRCCRAEGRRPCHLQRPARVAALEHSQSRYQLQAEHNSLSKTRPRIGFELDAPTQPCSQAPTCRALRGTLTEQQKLLQPSDALLK